MRGMVRKGTSNQFFMRGYSTPQKNMAQLFKVIVGILLLEIAVCQSCNCLPSAPADLEATGNGIGSLNISWSPGTVEGLVVNFTVVVVNLNDSTIGPMEVSGIQDQHYIFTNRADSTSCDVYRFQITAINGSETGNSGVITKTLPSPPDISLLQDSLKYSLARTASGVTLSVTFNGATSCPDYPVTNHTIILVRGSTRDKEIIILKKTSDGVFGLEDFALERNTQYFFYVTASNEVTTVNSMPERIVTSDVQGVVFIQVGVDTYTIQCSYLSGSTVSGCVYILVSGQSGFENMTGFIERDSQGVSIMIDNLGCYSEVMAHDNTTGSLPVRTSTLTNETCHIYTIPPPKSFDIIERTYVIAPLVANLTAPSSGSQDFKEMVVVGAVTLTLIVIALVLNLWYFCKYKKKEMEAYNEEEDTLENKNLSDERKQDSNEKELEHSLSIATLCLPPPTDSPSQLPDSPPPNDVTHHQPTENIPPSTDGTLHSIPQNQFPLLNHSEHSLSSLVTFCLPPAPPVPTDQLPDSPPPNDVTHHQSADVTPTEETTPPGDTLHSIPQHQSSTFSLPHYSVVPPGLIPDVLPHSPCPSAGTSSRPSAGTSSRPSAGTSSRPSAGTSSRSSAGTSSRPSAGTSSRPSAGTSSCPSADISSHISADISPHSSTYIPYTGIHNHSHADIPNQLLTNVTNQPLADAPDQPPTDLSTEAFIEPLTYVSLSPADITQTYTQSQTTISPSLSPFRLHSPAAVAEVSSHHTPEHAQLNYTTLVATALPVEMTSSMPSSNISKCPMEAGVTAYNTISPAASSLDHEPGDPAPYSASISTLHAGVSGSGATTSGTSTEVITCAAYQHKASTQVITGSPTPHMASTPAITSTSTPYTLTPHGASTPAIISSSTPLKIRALSLHKTSTSTSNRVSISDISSIPTQLKTSTSTPHKPSTLAPHRTSNPAITSTQRSPTPRSGRIGNIEEEEQSQGTNSQSTGSSKNSAASGGFNSPPGKE